MLPKIATTGFALFVVAIGDSAAFNALRLAAIYGKETEERRNGSPRACLTTPSPEYAGLVFLSTLSPVTILLARTEPAGAMWEPHQMV
jgi:hypothetical protein